MCDIMQWGLIALIVSFSCYGKNKPTVELTLADQCKLKLFSLFFILLCKQVTAAILSSEIPIHVKLYYLNGGCQLTLL